MAFGMSAGAAQLLGSVAGPAISAVVGGNASKKAANAQARAAAASDATQRYFYDQTRSDNSRTRQIGGAANNRLAALMGLDLPADTSETNFNAQKYLAANPDAKDYMATSGRSAYQHYLDDGSRRTGDFFNEAPGMGQGDPQFGALARNFTTADRDADPVYQSGLQFGLDEGTKGINRQAAAGGNFMSGATLKALTRFGNDYGSTKANESYNRFNNNQTQQYNRLAGLSGAGQQATNQVSAAGGNAANQISASQQGAGNARASGYIGGANALSGAIGQGYNNYQNNRLMSQFGGGFGAGGGGGAGGGFGAPLNSFFFGNGGSGD